jgi:hypothetical protein
VQRREAGDIARNSRHQGKPEIEVQRLDVSAGRPVCRRDHEVTDDFERGSARLGIDRLYYSCGHGETPLVRLQMGRESR